MGGPELRDVLLEHSQIALVQVDELDGVGLGCLLDLDLRPVAQPACLASCALDTPLDERKEAALEDPPLVCDDLNEQDPSF